MAMKRLALLILVTVPFAAGTAFAQVSGDVQAGKTFWNGAAECRLCHGVNGEGAFGPDLAGRGLSLSQFKHAVRKPWGIMPAFVETQVSDQDLANAAAYVATLPRVEEPGPWLFPLPANASNGQALFYAIG